MLFFSVYCLKSLISFGIILTLILGIVLLYILVYSFLISSVTAQILPDFRNGFIATFMITSILMIFSSLSGIYGLIRKRNKFVILYSVTMLIYFIAFLLLGCFMIKYPTYLKTQCQDPDPTVSSIRQAVEFANETLGKTCQCDFHSQVKYTIHELRILDRMGFKNYSDDSTLPVNSENCDNWSNTTYIATNSLIFLQTVFNCSGWCKTEPQFNLYYLFTDVNRGLPQFTCIESLLQFFDEFGSIMEISCFGASCLLFLILLAILCLCCHPDRGQEYDAMKFFKSTLMIELNEQNTTQSIN